MPPKSSRSRANGRESRERASIRRERGSPSKRVCRQFWQRKRIICNRRLIISDRREADSPRAHFELRIARKWHGWARTRRRIKRHNRGIADARFFLIRVNGAIRGFTGQTAGPKRKRRMAFLPSASCDDSYCGLEFLAHAHVPVTVTDIVQGCVVVVVERAQHSWGITIEHVVHADCKLGIPEHALPDR